jgi:O-antigen/teichoic acid export membrane protein
MKKFICLFSHLQNLFRHSRIRAELLASGILTFLSVTLLFTLDFILARKLGVAEFGRYSFTIAMVSIFAVIASTGLSSGVTRFIAEYLVTRSWRSIRGLISAASISLTISTFLIITIISILAYGPLADWEHVDSLFFVLPILPIMVFSLFRQGALRGLGKISEAILPKDVLLPMLLIIFAITYSSFAASDLLFWYFVFFLIVELVGLLWLWMAIPEEAKILRPKLELSRWIHTIPQMGIISLLQIGLSRWDLIILGSTSDAETTGVYAASIRLALVLGIVSRVIGLAMAPYITQSYYEKSTKELGSLLNKIFLIAIAFSIPPYFVLLFLSSELLNLFGSEFINGSYALRLLASGQFFLNITLPFQLFLLMTKHQTALLLTMMLSTFTLIVLYLSMAHHGMNMLATINALGMLVLAIGYIVVARHQIKQLGS